MSTLTDRRVMIVLSLLAGLTALAIPGASSSEHQSNSAIPSFQLRLLDGKLVRSSDLRGRVTVIDFWGTWCGPCLTEIPGYNEFYRQYRSRGVIFFAPALDSGTEDEVRVAIRKLGIEYPVAVPSMQELEALGDIQAVPTTWVINKRGEIEEEFLGTSPGKHERLRALVDRLLAGK